MLCFSVQKRLFSVNLKMQKFLVLGDNSKYYVQNPIKPYLTLKVLKKNIKQVSHIISQHFLTITSSHFEKKV